MKKSINLLLAAMILLTMTFNVQANPIEDDGQLIVKVAPSEKGKAFDLRLANLKNERTKIKVIDVVGYTLHSETVTKEVGYSQTINLENLPIGDYLLHVQHPSGDFTHAFHLGGELVSFFETKDRSGGFTQLVGQNEKDKISAVFTVQNNLLNVEVDYLEGKTTRVHICDLKGKLFFNKKIKTPSTSKQSYDTNKLPDGTYIMVVRSGKNTTIQPFEKMANGIQLKNTLVSKPLALGEMEVYTQR